MLLSQGVNDTARRWERHCLQRRHRSSAYYSCFLSSWRTLVRDQVDEDSVMLFIVSSLP
jgi:hypothetical protein